MRGVTISGADDRVDPHALVELQQEFPFVEWGILMSLKRRGTPRYPTDEWIKSLPPDLSLSLHCCGEVARSVLAGTHIPWHRAEPRFDRYQLNGYEAPVTADFCDTAALWSAKNSTVILQVREESQLAAAIADVRLLGGRASADILFDPSGGRGIPLDSIPRSPDGLGMGYAGGITPANVERMVVEIDRIGEPFWIDMETGVRTGDQFDLALVADVLGKCRPFITPAFRGP